MINVIFLCCYNCFKILLNILYFSSRKDAKKKKKSRGGVEETDESSSSGRRRRRENGGAAWKRRRGVEDGVRIKGREGPRERRGPPERGVQDWLGTGGARHTFGGSLIFRVWPGPSGTAKTCPRTFCSRDHFCILLSINSRVA